MSDDNTISFTISDADHMYLFHKWFTPWSIKDGITYMEELIAGFYKKYTYPMSFNKGG